MGGPVNPKPGDWLSPGVRRPSPVDDFKLPAPHDEALTVPTTGTTRQQAIANADRIACWYYDADPDDLDRIIGQAHVITTSQADGTTQPMLVEISITYRRRRQP
jgi:hypothetical protein